jgi:hypothetical protein
MIKKYTIALFALLTGVVQISGYTKKCYIHPRYSRHGSLQDLKDIMGKHFDHSAQYTFEDERRSCHIHLDGTDMFQMKCFLKKRTPETLITDEIIENLLRSQKAHSRAVGLILRDFKLREPDVTVQRVGVALGFNKDESLNNKEKMEDKQ